MSSHLAVGLLIGYTYLYASLYVVLSYSCTKYDEMECRTHGISVKNAVTMFRVNDVHKNLHATEFDTDRSDTELFCRTRHCR